MRQIVALAVSWFIIAMPLAKAADALTNAAQVRTLTTQEAATAGHRVEISAVITFADITRGLLFAQDSTAGIFVSPQARGWDWRAGQKVRILGVVSQGSHLPFINQALIEDLGTAPMPVARAVGFRQLEADSEDANWVEVKGVVQSAGIEGGQLRLAIAADGKKINVIFSDTPSSQTSIDELVDAEVSVRGVCGMKANYAESTYLLDLHVPALEWLVINRPSTHSLATPVIPISAIGSAADAGPYVHRVHVIGTMKNGDARSHFISDESGTVAIETVRAGLFEPNSAVEVYGFPRRSTSGLILDNVKILQLAQSLAEGDTNRNNSGPDFLPILNRAQDIRRMGSEDLQRGYPVRIQGMVTYLDPGWNLFFVQDDSAGIYVFDPDRRFSGKMGDFVEVTGFTGQGKFAPIIREARFRLLASKPQIAKPRRPTQEQLFSGEMDGQQVELEGVIKYVQKENGHLELHLSSSGSLIKTFVPSPEPSPIPTNLIDAEVLVRGVYGTWFNTNRQLTDVGAYVQTLNDVRVTKAPPADPFSIPQQPIGNLLQFQTKNEQRHRIHIRGSVTFRDPDYCTLFLSDVSGSIFIRCLARPEVEVGDIIDVAGFVSPSASGPTMSEAVLKRIGRGAMPVPLKVVPREAFAGQVDARLITLEARALEPVRDNGGHGMVFQAEDWVFVAYLPGSQSAHSLASVLPGTLVRLTGVCSRTAIADAPSGRMLLWLRSPGDIVVLANPSWTSRQLMVLVGLMALCLALAAAWVVLLRKAIRHKAAALRRSETQLVTIYENTPIMMCLMNEQFEVVQMNRAMLEFFRKISKGNDPKRIGSLMGCINATGPQNCGFGSECGACPIRLSIISTFKTGRSSRQIERLFSFAWMGSPREVWVSVSTALMQIEGSPKVLVCLEDISDRKRLEAQFLQAQKMEAIGQLAGGVAHDFNNILTAAIMNISNLRRNSSLDQEMAEGLIDLEKDAYRAADLTRQLLLFSRRQAMSPRRLDLNDVLSSVMKLLKRLLGENIRMAPEYSSAPVWVNADRGLLEQLITNLCVNARDAMPDGGVLTLRIERTEIQPQQVLPESDARAGLFACLTVEDTGIGMDSATLGRIFEPFFTTKEVGKGTGLGLATVYGIVKQHHGWVDVRSTVGLGTTFCIYLPAADVGHTPPDAETKSDPSGGSETVLLVEDDSSLRRVVTQVLGRYGYTVLEAGSGIDALKVWEQQNGRIHLLLTDMVMPEGMGGLELARQLRKLKPGLKVVLSTGYSAELQSANPEKDGMRMLPKPYEPDALVKMVRMCLDQ